MRNITLIVVHCSADKFQNGIDFKGVDYVRKIHKKKGWSDVGYHFVIKTDGTVDDGRDIEKIGAHAKGYNSNSIGVCYIGGLNDDGDPEDTRTEAQVHSLVNLITELKERFPGVVVKGHRDLSPDKDGDGVIEKHEWMKACPCFDAMEEFNYDV